MIKIKFIKGAWRWLITIGMGLFALLQLHILGTETILNTKNLGLFSVELEYVFKFFTFLLFLIILAFSIGLEIKQLLFENEFSVKNLSFFILLILYLEINITKVLNFFVNNILISKELKMPVFFATSGELTLNLAVTWLQVLYILSPILLYLCMERGINFLKRFSNFYLQPLTYLTTTAISLFWINSFKTSVSSEVANLLYLIYLIPFYFIITHNSLLSNKNSASV